MKEIIESKDIPLEDEVWLTKDKKGWRIVYPTKHPITGKRNWSNTLYGGSRNLQTLMIYLVLTLIIGYGVSTLISEYRDVAENPCNYCRLSSQYGSQNQELIDSLKMNTKITIPNASEDLDYGVEEG